MSDYNCFRKQRPKGLVLSLLLILGLCLSAMPARSQDKKDQKKSTDEGEVIKVTSNLVNLDVMVKDKKGKIITDLKKEDFIVNENGVQQDIQFFDSTLTAGDEPARAASAPTSPGTPPPNKLPRNIISLVLDLQTTETANLKHVRDGIIKYIRERISDTDSVALFSISAGLRLLQPFTQDKTKLIAAAEKAYSSNVSKTSEQRDLTESIAALREQLAGSGAESLATQAGGSSAAEAMIARRVLEQYVQLRSALSAQQSRPILAALAAICEGLRPIRGKKTLVMFSQGFVAPEVLDWQVQSTIDIANRANVAIYIIDSTGLTGGTPQSGALWPGSALSAISGENSQESRIRAGAGESVFDISRHEGLNRQQDLLYRISEDTGGRFIKNTNDIGAGLDRIDVEIRARYTLAYRSTNQNFDGSFRKVKIEVRRSDANVVARPGYYAIPPSQVVPFSPEERSLLANFSRMLGQSSLPLSMELDSFRTQQGYYVVPVSFEIPPSALRFDRKSDKQRLQLDVLGVVRNEGEDKILSRFGGNFDVQLSEQQYESILNDKIFYRQDMQLEAGTYTIDLVVKDRLSGKTAAKRETLALPVADSEFRATEVVLSRHAEPFRQKLAAPNDVLSEGNVQIRPSPSREFRPTDNLIIFFNLYNASPSPVTGKPLVNVTVRLMKDGHPAIKPLDYTLMETVAEPVQHMTFAKYVKLTGLAPGKYSVVIENRDTVRNKLVKQEAWFLIKQ
jgi:VWFA-related protein